MGDIFINDLYFGNVDAQKSKLNSSKMFRKKMEILSETEKELLENLDRENLALFEKYVDAWAFINSESNRDSFRNGFRLGAKCGFDVFAD